MNHNKKWNLAETHFDIYGNTGWTDSQLQNEGTPQNGGYRNEYFRPDYSPSIIEPQGVKATFSSERKVDEKTVENKRKSSSSGGLKKKRGRAGMVVSMAAVALLSGVIGGGSVYFLAETQAPATPPSSTGTAAPISTTQGATAGSLTEVAAAATPSVVEITTETSFHTGFLGQNQNAQSAGSGVIFSKDGYIVTNNHVIDGADTIKVRTVDGTEYVATLVGTDSQTDLAVLKIGANNLVPATFADSKQVAVGESVLAIGNPLGTLGGTVTDGIVSAINREITIGNEKMDLLQTSAAVNPGNSGGGLFNERGELIGIVNAKTSAAGVEGLGFAIPSNTVKEVVGEIVDRGYVSGRVQLGVSFVEVTDARTAMLYEVDEPGVYVSGFSETNLQPGDRVLTLEGKEITSIADIKSILEEHQVGDQVTMGVMRNGKKVDVSISLTERVPEKENTEK